jgi:hypothetical protein
LPLVTVFISFGKVGQERSPFAEKITFDGKSQEIRGIISGRRVSIIAKIE